MNITVLILGTNMGDRQHYLEAAIDFIRAQIGVVVRCSSVYETEPWGYSDESQYLNQVVNVETFLAPFDVLAAIDRIEQILGRTRGEERYAARTLDIDILFYNDCVINAPNLIIPHARLADRRFVLEPLAEILPDFEHPVLAKTMLQLLEDCQDECQVIRVNGG